MQLQGVAGEPAENVADVEPPVVVERLCLVRRLAEEFREGRMISEHLRPVDQPVFGRVQTREYRRVNGECPDRRRDRLRVQRPVGRESVESRRRLVLGAETGDEVRPKTIDGDTEDVRLVGKQFRIILYGTKIDGLSGNSPDRRIVDATAVSSL